MYQFRKVTPEEAHGFAEAQGIFSQTKYWGRFRNLFRTEAFLGEKNGETALSCMLYRLPVYGTRWSIGYITRGFVCDWRDEVLVREFTDFLKDYCTRKRIAYVILDPWTDYRVDFRPPEKDLRQLLEKLGYRRNVKGVLQPGNNYRLNFRTDNDREEEKKRICDGFGSKLKARIRYGEERGLTLERCRGADTDRGVGIFYQLLLQTTDKKGFGHRKESYYRNMARALSPYVTIYLYRYDHRKDFEETDDALHKCRAAAEQLQAEYDRPETSPQRRARLESRLREAKKQADALENRIPVILKYQNDPYLSASFYIKCGDKAYNLYGANADALRELKLSASYRDMILDSIEDGRVESFNMGGTLKLDTADVRDDRMYDLYLYKKQYGGEFVEMPGEYFLIIDWKKYHLFHEKLNYFRRMVFHF